MSSRWAREKTCPGLTICGRLPHARDRAAIGRARRCREAGKLCAGRQPLIFSTGAVERLRGFAGARCVLESPASAEIAIDAGGGEIADPGALAVAAREGAPDRAPVVGRRRRDQPRRARWRRELIPGQTMASMPCGQRGLRRGEARRAGRRNAAPRQGAGQRGGDIAAAIGEQTVRDHAHPLAGQGSCR